MKIIQYPGSCNATTRRQKSIMQMWSNAMLIRFQFSPQLFGCKIQLHYKKNPNVFSILIGTEASKFRILFLEFICVG